MSTSPSASAPQSVDMKLQSKEVFNGESALEVSPSPPSTILTGKRLFFAFVAMLSSVLVEAMDQTILATALPRIASDFDAFTLQGWVSTSFLLAQSVFLLPAGQLLRIFPAKWVLVYAVVLFQLGSLLCAVSQNIDQLIAGRTISGAGAAGSLIAILQILAQSTLLEDRPALFGWFGAVFQVATISGSLIGGAFTDRVTWRWCFYINIPVGVVSVTAVIFIVKALPPLGSDPDKRSWHDLGQQVARMDFVGATLVAGAVTSLVLALQWGGNTKSWGNKDVIICLVFATVLSTSFFCWEKFLGDRAMSPSAIFHSRSIYALLLYTFLLRFCFLLFTYYFPIFYQAARHHSAVKSGVDVLPFLVGTTITILSTGQISGMVGYYWPMMVLSPILIMVGSGVLFTLNTSTSLGELVGLQLIAGLGTGMGMQSGLIAMQFEFQQDNPKLLGQATSVGFFWQFLGGTIGLGVAEPVFAAFLNSNLRRFAPDAPAQLVRDAPTAIYTDLPADLIPGVVRSYTGALRVVFVLGIPVAGAALLAAMLIRNIRIEKTRSENSPVGGSDPPEDDG